MPTATPPAKPKACQYISAEPLAAAKVDAAAGILRDVAIMSIGEAAGHGCDVDTVTLTKLFELTQGKTVKAFLNHSWNPSPDEVVGVFSGLYIDTSTGVLRASQFQALGAFKTHNAKAYDTLFELAAIAPDSFGVSVSIYQDLAWKLSDGTEMLTDGWGNKPEKAVGDKPFIRPTFIESADFVSSPAANTALFSREPKKPETKSQEALDIAAAKATQEKQTEIQSQQLAAQKKTFSTMKAVFAHFAANPKALPFIAKFTAEMPDGAKPEDVIAKVELALSEEEQAAVVAERDALKTQVSELQAEVAKLKPDADKTAELSKEVDGLKTQVAQFGKSRARFGATPIAIAKTGEGEKPAEVTGHARVAAFFAKESNPAK